MHKQAGLKAQEPKDNDWLKIKIFSHLIVNNHGFFKQFLPKLFKNYLISLE